MALAGTYYQYGFDTGTTWNYVWDDVVWFLKDTSLDERVRWVPREHKPIVQPFMARRYREQLMRQSFRIGG